MHKVLIVDDKPEQAELMCILLTELNIECIVAYTGIDAVGLAKQLKPDLILMDWIMPAKTLTGNDATQQILSDSETHNIPVIACSAGDLSQAIKIGCADCVSKPFHIDMFLDMIRHYLS